MKYNFSVINKQTLYQGFHKIELFDFKFDKFAGGESDIVSRELSRRKSCVGLLPFDPVRKEILLIEQIRLGPLANQEHPWLLEIVAGIIEDDESKESTVLREAKEEANCSISKLIPIYNYYLTPGGSSEKINLYCGITDTSNAGGVYGVEHEDEDIKVHIVKFKDAMDMLEDGKIINSSTIIALQWLALNINNIK